MRKIFGDRKLISFEDYINTSKCLRYISELVNTKSKKILQRSFREIVSFRLMCVSICMIAYRQGMP